MLRILLLSIAMLACTQAFAQSRGVLDDRGDIIGNSEVQDNARGGLSEPHKWRVLVGGGVVVAPTFSGSEDYRVGIAPLIQVAYRPFFFGLDGVGVDLHRDRNWRLSLNLTGSRGRKESDDDHLRGLGDVDSTLRAGATASYSNGHFMTKVQLLTDIAGKHQGTLARVDAYARFVVAKRLILLLGPGVTYTNGQYAQTFYGVTPVQQTNSGIAQFDAGGGVNSVRLAASGVYIFNRHWIGVASASTSQLQGDAARSPITETRSQNLLFVAAAYSF